MLKVASEISEIRRYRKEYDDSLGFVPTMGFLHEGHLSLVRRAKAENKFVAVSIFVNPSQFGPQEDLAAYPRDLERDINLLEGEGVNLIWTPTESIMYPPEYQTWVEVSEITKKLEGASRPTHFRGVTTVVTKLFNVIQPDRAYFGQKDAQQAAVIRQMVSDLNMPLEIVICPISRETDGLARSSRNTYLDPDQRKAATVLSRSLQAARAAYDSGERDGEKIRKTMLDVLSTEPLARVDYVSCADPLTLDELKKITQSALLSMAVFIGKTRLIDNLILG